MVGGAGANRARNSYNEIAGQVPTSHTGHSGGPSPYDGPASQPSSQHGDPPRQNPFGQGLGYDPAKPTAAKPSLITNTRVELPAAAYALDGGVSYTLFLLSFFNIFQNLDLKLGSNVFAPFGLLLFLKQFVLYFL